MRGETKLTLSLVCVYRPADGWLLFAPAQRTPVSIIDILWHWTQSEQLLQTVTHLPLGDSRCSLLTADCGLYQSVLVCSLEQDNINYNTILDMMLPLLYQSEGFRFDILPNRNPQSGQCWDSIVITHSLCLSELSALVASVIEKNKIQTTSILLIKAGLNLRGQNEKCDHRKVTMAISLE